MTIHPLQEFPHLRFVEELPAFLARDPDDRTPLGRGHRQIFFQAITAEEYRSLKHAIRLSIGFGKLEDHHDLATVVGTLNNYTTFATEEEIEAADEARTIYVGYWVVGWDGLARPLFTEEDMDRLRETRVILAHHVFPPYYEKLCSVLMDYLNGRLSHTGWRAEFHETVITDNDGGLLVNSPVPLTGYELGRMTLAPAVPFQSPLWKVHPTFQL